MKTYARLVTAITVAFCFLFLLTACVTSTTVRLAPGVPFDRTKIALIRPGVTTLSEILDWFGPPDYIIDGTITMLEPIPPPYYFSIGSVPTMKRELRAPEGMVIAVYLERQGYKDSKMAYVPVVAAASKYGEIYREKELFIYISKKRSHCDGYIRYFERRIILKITLKRTLLVLSVFCLEGCTGTTLPSHWIHEPPLVTNVPKIVKGQTTRQEVLQYFGEPDIQADGANAKVSSDMPLLLMYREWLEWPLPDLGQSESVKVFPYSSIDDEHMVFVYAEHRFSLKEIVKYFGPGGLVNEITYYPFNNKLLFFINKETGLVDDFSFREEFKVHCSGRSVRHGATHRICYHPITELLE